MLFFALLLYIIPLMCTPTLTFFWHEKSGFFRPHPLEDGLLITSQRRQALALLVSSRRGEPSAAAAGSPPDVRRAAAWCPAGDPSRRPQVTEPSRAFFELQNSCILSQISSLPSLFLYVEFYYPGQRFLRSLPIWPQVFHGSGKGIYFKPSFYWQNIFKVQNYHPS